MFDWVRSLFKEQSPFSEETQQAIKDLQKQSDDFVAMTKETEFAEMPSGIIMPPEQDDELIRFEVHCPKCGTKMGVSIKKEKVNGY